MKAVQPLAKMLAPELRHACGVSKQEDPEDSSQRTRYSGEVWKKINSHKATQEKTAIELINSWHKTTRA